MSLHPDAPDDRITQDSRSGVLRIDLPPSAYGTAVDRALTYPSLRAIMELQEREDERRAKWDERFLDLAALVASWSKDPSTKCGAVIVRPDRTVASVGFNGFPKGCDDDPDKYADRDLKLARVVHAELNALLLAREPLNGYTLYTHPAGIGPSCDRCTVHIIQAGIARVVHRYDESAFGTRWADAVQRGLDMYAEAGVEVTHLD